MIELEYLAQAEVRTDPIPHLCIGGIVSESQQPGLIEDFPDIDRHGSFPLNNLRYGAKFAELIADLTSSRFSAIVGDKLGLDLTDRPVMVTVRALSDAKDGQIHVDNPNKLVTLLLYLGGTAGAESGRLRLLRSKHLDDFAAEITPEFGTLLIFKNTPNAWHGFLPFSGVRRVIQVNWVSTEKYRRRELNRHGLSATIKSLFSGKSGRENPNAA